MIIGTPGLTRDTSSAILDNAKRLLLKLNVHNGHIIFGPIVESSGKYLSDQLERQAKLFNFVLPVYVILRLANSLLTLGPEFALGELWHQNNDYTEYPLNSSSVLLGISQTLEIKLYCLFL